MNKTEIEEWISKGYLHTRVILEVLGKPKEHIEKTLQQYVERICSSDNIKVISNDVAEAKEQEKEQMWSTFAEIEFLIKGISKLVGFCFDYMPSSVEILAPDRILFNHHTITDFVNDLQAKLHKMDMVLKNQQSENKFLKKNMNMMIQNLVTLSLHGKRLDQAQLSKITGIPGEGLKPFIENLLKENRIKEQQGKYCLA